MLNNHFRNIFELRQMYSIGQEFYYSCLITDFEWFEKKFSIIYLIEPMLLHISKQTIMPANITSEDKFIIQTLNTSNIIRKYNMVLELSNMYNLDFVVYEKNDTTIFVIHKSDFLFDTDKDEMDLDFMRLVINVQRQLENYKDDTIIDEDDNYDLFKRLYTTALNLYPEEIIKIHDKNV